VWSSIFVTDIGHQEGVFQMAKTKEHFMKDVLSWIVLKQDQMSNRVDLSSPHKQINGGSQCEHDLWHDPI
jgi:hypothetical protein